MNIGNTRELLIEAANRAANYIEGLSVRDVRPLRGSVERLMEVLDNPLPDNHRRWRVLGRRLKTGRQATLNLS